MSGSRTRTMPTTRTYVALDVPQEFYDFVKKELEEADYDHAFIPHGDGVIALDMSGIALIPKTDA